MQSVIEFDVKIIAWALLRFYEYVDYITSNDRVTMNAELERIWK
jgi:hypothetical protein